MLANFKNSFTVGLSSKFATRLVPYDITHHTLNVSLHSLPFEIQRINYNNSLDVFNSITDLLLNISIVLDSY